MGLGPGVEGRFKGVVLQEKRLHTVYDVRLRSRQRKHGKQTLVQIQLGEGALAGMPLYFVFSYPPWRWWRCV
jgi:hypothetical protein